MNVQGISNLQQEPYRTEGVKSTDRMASVFGSEQIFPVLDSHERLTGRLSLLASIRSMSASAGTVFAL
jgi:hypothetical protein